MVGMTKPLNFDDPASEIALFRYGLIAHLIHEPAASGLLEESLRQIAQQTLRDSIFKAHAGVHHQRAAISQGV